MSESARQESSPVMAYNLDPQKVFPFKGPEVKTGGPFDVTE